MADYSGVFVRIRQREMHGRKGVYPGKDRDNRQWKHNPHSEHSNQNTPRQEAPLREG